jgi:hypothetical protein
MIENNQGSISVTICSAPSLRRVASSPANITNPITLGVLTDPRTFVPGMPFAAYPGLKTTF